MHRTTRVLLGGVAGAAGTLAMDLLWYRRADTDADFTDWDTSDASSFDDAGAPAAVGQQVTDAAGVDIPDREAGRTTNVVHWLTGVGYGLAHGAVADGRAPVRHGLATGAGAWANAYATLGAAGVYKPIWEYDRETLQRDLTAHLLYGTVTGLVHAALVRGLGDGQVSDW